MDKGKPQVVVVSEELKHPEPLQRATTHDPRDLVKNWPTEANKLEKYQREWSTTAYDIVLILLPVGLLAKATVAAVFGLHMNTEGNLDLIPTRVKVLVALDDQLVTLFTIVFATIIATLVRRVALWRAQRGASVATLEQLHASTSLPKTLSSIWSLRAFSLTSILLVVIWSWYYLGSQAASRELAFYDSAHLYNLKMAYLNAAAPSAFDEGAPNSRALARTNARYLVKLGASGTHTMDLSSGWDDSREALIPVWDFEFAKVFSIDSPHGGHGIDLDGWWDADLPTYQVWASSMGIPFLSTYNESGCGSSDCIRLTDQLIGHVRFNTSYIQANCSEVKFEDAPFHDITKTTAPTFNTIFNMTNATLPTILASREFNGRTLTTMCNLTTTDIELEIECGSQGCKTTRARPTPNQKLSVDFFYNSTSGQVFLDNMVAAIGSPSYDGEDFLQSSNRMQDARNRINQASANPTNMSAAAVVLPASRGLTQMINTYLSASQQALIDPTDSQALIDGVLGVDLDTFSPAVMHGAPYAPQYRISWPWLIVDFVSCIVLLAASILAVVLGRCTLAPDVFGYVSSLTRDNPNISLPDGGSMLPGLERARKMKHVKVQLADVRPEGVGRVGLTVAGAGHGCTLDGVGRLEKGKEYL